MKFSYNWLKELADFKQTPQELADLITLHITEVESVSSKSAGYTGVIVAEILQIDAHPNATKLHLVTLDIGLGKRVTVVCGANNIEVGQTVPLALVGAKLPVGEISAAVIRGVESTGMICSGAELGLEKESAGILVLDKKASVGRPAQEYLEISEDTILDLKILSNRPDYLSYTGLAREISAISGKDYHMAVDLSYLEDASIKTKDKISVEVLDPEGCPKYLAHYISNVEVKESPSWLQEKLLSSGIRPISNVVDISNYIMLELGQPIHTFSADKLKGNQIVVRRAKAGEEILTLDGQTHKLNSEVLVIADSENPIAIAGIMGAETSGVTDLTKDIVVEVATFNPAIIRKGSKSLGLSTDASIRYERGLQPYLVDIAMQRTLSLIKQIIPEAQIATGNVEVMVKEQKYAPIELSIEQINNLIGAKLTASEITKILQKLEFEVTNSGKNMVITPPPWRRDIKEMADIAEEVVRMWGIDKIKPVMPVVTMTAPALNLQLIKINQLKDLLVKCGFSETPSHAFIGEEWANKLGFKLDDELKVSNPLNSQWTHLNSNLWPNLLKFCGNAGSEPVKFFEIATIFTPPLVRHSGLDPESRRKMLNQVQHDGLGGQDDEKGGTAGDEYLPVEIPLISMLISGKTPEAYRTLRGVVETIVVNVPKFKFVAVPGSPEDNFVNILRIMVDREIIGTIEEVSPRLAHSIDVPEGTVWAEVNLQKLMELSREGKKYQEISRFPSSQFDVSVELPPASSAGIMIDEIWQTSSLIQSVEVFDVYQLPNGGRSIGLRVVVQAFDRTLTETDIKTIESKVITLIITQHRGKLR